MSDFFNQFGNQLENQRNRQAQENLDRLTGKGDNFAAERDEQHASRLEEIRKRNERAQKLREQYGFDYSLNQYGAISDAIDNGIIVEDQGYDILAAQTIADNFKRQGINIDPSEIYENLPLYSEYVLGRPEGQSARTPKTNLAAIHGAFVVAGANMRKNILGMQLADARSNNNAELENIIRERLRQENETVEEYNDYQKRNFFVEAGKFAAQSSAYTAFVMAGGMLGGAPGAFMAGWAGATGQSYLGLTDAGVEHKLAYPFAVAAGAVNAIIESQLGNAAGLVGRTTGARTLQQSIAKRAAAYVSDKLHLSGAALKMATGPVARYILEGIGEMNEEIFQEIADIVSTELAAFLQKEGVELGREDYVRRVAEAAKGGFMASLFMGIPGLAMDTVGSFSDYKTLRIDADTIPNELMFKDRHKDSPLRGEMTDEEWDKELSKIHKGRQGIREREESRIAEELKAAAGLGEGYAEQEYKEDGTPIPLGETYYRRNGQFYTELDEKRGLFKGGDARIEGKNNLYFHFGYSLDDDGTVQINEFRVRNDLDTPEFRRKAFAQFAEAFAGHEIAWDANTAREAEIRENLIKGNPYGEKAGLNYYSQEDSGNVSGARYRNRVIDNFKRYFPHLGNAEHAVMAAEWEHFANMQGASLEEYVTREFGGLEKAFTADPNRRIDAAMKEGHQIKGAVTFESMAQDAKAAIYLSKNADLTTFIHEMGHIYRRRLSGEMLAEANRLWGVTDGEWTTAQEEQFTEDLERWRREGKAPTPEMQTFFEKFAEFLKSIFNAVSQRAEVSPEIKEFFDKLYAGEQAQNAAGSARMSQKGHESGTAGKNKAAGTKSFQETAREQQRAGKSADGYVDIDEWVKTLPEENQRLYRENNALNTARGTIDKNADKGDLKPKQTGVTTAQELRDKAAKHIDELRSWVNGIAEKYDARVIERKVDEKNPLPLKKLARIQEKIDEGGDVTQILDVLGMTIVAKDFKTMIDISVEMRQRDDVVRVKDRYRKVKYRDILKSGYRDILCNIQLSDEMIAEVQINTEQMLKAKEGDGHKIYKIERVLDKEVESGRLTEDQAKTDRMFLLKLSNELYDAAYHAGLSESQFNASSRDILCPSWKDIDVVNLDLVSDLSPFTLNKFREFGLSANNSSEYTSPSMSMNSNEESSNNGTSTAGDVSLSTVAAEAGTTELSNISVPSTNSIASKINSVNSNSENISEKNSPENEKRIKKAKAKWEGADRVKGAEDQITLQTGEIINGRYELGEAGISTPSVDPDSDFTQSEGFPVNENGTSMNVGRDYTQGFSQDAALRMAAEFDQRGTGIIVDGNGVISSGNNRDISRRIAAKNGTDGKYISYLKSRPERWGFTQEDIAKYKHPTVYFAVNAPAAYSPLYFDRFNRSGKKSVSPLETAIKMSYLLNGENRKTVNEFSAAMGNYDSIDDLYEDTQAATEIFKSLMKKGIVTENSYPDYVETVSIKGKRQERITSGGKEFLESVMLGAVLNEDSIRSLALVPEIRKRVVKGLAALVDNAAMGEYCVVPEINQAISVAVEIQTNKKKYKSITDYADQTEMELGQRVSTDIEVELAGRLMEKTEYAFSDMMGGLNAVLQEEARGQSDMFGGTSKDDILRRYLGVKARADEIRAANNKIIGSETAAGLEKVQAAMENAGLARSEADGTLFQLAYHGSPYRFRRYKNSYINKNNAFGWGHYFANRKEVAEWYRKKPSDGNAGNGYLYEADIPNDDELLDWDKKLDEQPERVRNAIEKILNSKNNNGWQYYITREWDALPEAQRAEEIKQFLSRVDGGTFYTLLAPEWEMEKDVSLYLKSMGIKGNRHLDETSGEGQHYVIFDDSDINITQTFFQLDDDLLEDAAQYDSWQEFRDAYEGRVGSVPEMTLDEYLVKQGLLFPVSDFMLDKSRLPHGNTLRQQKQLEKEVLQNSREYSERRNAAIAEYHKKVEAGEIRETSKLKERIRTALGDPANESTQAARRRLEKKGIDFQSIENETADNAWYRSLWNDAKKIHKDTLFQDEEKTGRAAELDRRFYKEADKKYLTEALLKLYEVHNDQSLEPAKDEDGASHEEYRRVKRLQHRINTELPNSGSIIGMAAQVRSGRELSSTQYDRLKSWIRKNARDYRSVLADIMGQDEYLKDLADVKDGEPAGRLADPRPDKQDIKARLKEIANIMRETDPALAKEIEDGTASYDDPRIAAFEAGVETEYAEAKTALDALEKETSEDYARLANDAQKRIVSIYEKMIKAREQLESTNEKLRRMMDEEGKIAELYVRKQRLLEQANYDQALKAYNDLVDLHGKDAEVREAIARREARASERVRQTGIRRRQRALRELKEIKKKLIKRVTRKVSFDTVAYEQAEMVKAIQRISEAFIFEGINKWIGPQGREILRGVWSQWSTDEEFRDTLTEQILKRKHGDIEAERIKKILDKDWKKITVAEKKALHRLLPKTDLINDLKLKELARENRESIQLDIDENYIDGQVRMIIGEDLKRRLKETLGEELFNRILNKPLAEWSIVEAEELARIVDRLTVEGRRDRAAWKEAKLVLEQEYRGKVLEALEKTGVVINPDDPPEEKERKREEQNRILKKFAAGKRNNILNNFLDANLRRFTTAMDGGRKGIFTSLLYWSENDAYNEEQRQIAARRIVIDKVMKENNINLDELYREVKIPALEGLYIDLYRVSGGKFTVDDLLYVMRGYQNEETRNALMYGNFSNADERKCMAGSLDEIEAFANVGHGRMMAVISYAKEFFAKEENKKFLKLYEAIGADYDRNGERLNKAMIDMFNMPMWRVDNYVPMNRREQTGAENENRVIEDLLGTTKAGTKWVNRGFTEKREKINPSGQRPIELGLYRTWAQSVNSTEHLLAYGPMVQTLNAVFKGYHAGEVRQALQDRWGKAADDRVGSTIAEFANPDPHRQRHALDDIVRVLRGKTATAYLAWKTSSVLKQMMTSPWPYLQEIPPRDYIAACLEVAAGTGKINDVIREKSIYMKNRDFDPMVKLIREAREKNDNAVLSKLDKFNNIGMKGLEWVDWVCVAPGWLAVYKSELANIAKEQQAKYEELLRKYKGGEYSDVLPTMESKANRALSETLSEEQQDAEAVARADDAVRRMQPSSRSTDIAPLFKSKYEVANALLQFQTALNVIWQNIRYDLPLAVKEKQIGTIVGMVTGYIMAGICLGMLSEIGNDDDDDKEGKLARRILFYSFTQFTDAVPVIGEEVTRWTERVITGKASYTGQQNIFPVVQKAFGGAGNIAGALWEEDPKKREERFVRAAQNMAEAFAIAGGGPVSGIKELGAAAGIGDGDGELDLYWQALLGQRK